MQAKQFDLAKRCAAGLYARASEQIDRAYWARMGAMTAFRAIDLPDALATFALSLQHLCELGDAGLVPPPAAPKRTNSAFANGVADRLYWNTATALAREQLPAFAHAGTLLGLHRDGRLLPFDKDIDLGVWCEHFQATRTWLLAHGWLAVTDCLPYKNYCALIDPQTKVTLDVLGMQRDLPKRRIRFGFFLDGFGPQYQSGRTVDWFDLVLRTTPRGTVWGIDQPERMLSALYGDWQTPNPYWDGMVSNLCIDETTLLWRCHGYDRLVMRWMNGELQRAWSYAHQILLKDPCDATVQRARQCLASILSRVDANALQWPAQRLP